MKVGIVCWIAGVSCLYFSFFHLFFGEAEWKSALFVPLLIYGFYQILFGKKDPVYWEKRQRFVVVAILFGMEIIVTLVMKKEIEILLLYVLAYLFLCLLALNIFRFGYSIDTKGKCLYGIQLGLYLLLCGACAGIVELLSKTGGKLLELLLTPFALILAAFVSLGSGITALLSEKKEVLEQATEVVREEVTQGQQTTTGQAVADATGGEILSWLFRIGGAVFAVVLLGYIFYRLYQFYKDRCVTTGEPDVVEGVTEYIGRRSFGKRTLFKTNREKIRREYAKHMRAVRVKGYRISKSSTSMDIFNEARLRLETGEETEKRIRELYRKARYSSEEITDEEVKEMRRMAQNGSN